MVVALVVLEGLKSTLVAEILSVLEGLVALEGFSIMANIGKKIHRIFLVAEGFACSLNVVRCL